MPPILSLCYLPPLSWCTAVWNSESVVIETQEHYQKGSLRNRCYIAGYQGVQRLSIPLSKGKHQQLPIREVRIASDEAWQRSHWRTIRTAYGNAPFFEHYADALAPFYERRYEFLFDFNLDLLVLVLKGKMGWRGSILYSETYSPAAPENAMLSDEGSGWPSWYSPAPYPQVFEEKNGFLPNLSVLDLLFCCGRRSGEILEKSCASA